MKKKPSEKPKKPYKTFPLFAHASGQWAKKINGSTRYFGKWENPKLALQNYHEQIADISLGREKLADKKDLTLQQLCNLWLKKIQEEEHSRCYVTNYHQVCRIMVATIGRSVRIRKLVPADFVKLDRALKTGYAAATSKRMITLCKVVLNYAFKQEFVDAPFRFGDALRPPSARQFRLEKAKRGPLLWTPDHIKQLVLHSEGRLRAAILLGINCGFGVDDVLNLEKSHLETGNRRLEWVIFPRGKTGIERIAWLWPRTAEAIQSLKVDRWAVNLLGLNSRTGIEYGFRELTKKLKIKKERLQFYGFRRAFQTFAEESRDFPAVSAVMGHAPRSGDMASVYRQGISRERIKHVCETVERIVFGDESTVAASVSDNKNKPTDSSDQGD